MTQPQVSKREQMKIIADSNALFVPLQFKIDIFEELKRLLNRHFELVLLSSVRRELEKMVKSSSVKTAKQASYALKLGEKCKLVETKAVSSDSVDDTIVQVASEWNCPVFTNDRALRKRLRDINVPVIYVRQKSHLEIDGRI